MVGDMIVNLYSTDDRWRKTNKYNVRAVFPSDKERVLDFVKKEFPNEKGWLMEISRAIQEGKCIIAAKDGQILGFGCYDCTGKGYFGPFGVKCSDRQKGIGTEIFCECLDAMKCCGYGYAIIGWVDESACDFYKKVSNAWYIPDTEPRNTLYKRKINIS